MKERCLIFGSGEYGDAAPDVSGNDIVIAADGGYWRLLRYGVRPDVLLGDFDSYDGPLPEDIPILRHPVEKDDTDMALAVSEGLLRGARRFVIYGGMGGRLDHTLANFQLAAGLARMGCEVLLEGAHSRAAALYNGGMRFSAENRGMVSVFAYGGTARGITERGLRYSLEDAELRDDVPRGVSNEFIGQAAAVEVRDGTLLLIWEDNAAAPPVFYRLEERTVR